MPSTSKKQAAAMAAAAAGKSKLGIPKKVGKKFLRADRRKSKGRAKKKGKGGMPSRSDHLSLTTRPS